MVADGSATKRARKDTYSFVALRDGPLEITSFWGYRALLLPRPLSTPYSPPQRTPEKSKIHPPNFLCLWGKAPGRADEGFSKKKP